MNQISLHIEEAKREVHKGCSTTTRLSFIIRMLYIKSYNRVTNRAFDQIMSVLCAALPDVNFPKLYANSKRVLSEVGLGYETIHVCKFDYVLFWGIMPKTLIVPCVVFQDGETWKERERFLTRYLGTFQ
jgi:hypothetical protein